MKRFLIGGLVLCVACAFGLYRFNEYWKHRFDRMIVRQAVVYNLDAALVWSVIYEETYFRPWIKGDAGEIGLMQVTPAVGREWAAETGLADLISEMERNPEAVLRDPERNVAIGCWYLEKIGKRFRNLPGATARTLAAYNAGPSRAAAWSRTASGAAPLSEAEFIDRVNFPTTHAYVQSILQRARAHKTVGSRIVETDEARSDIAFISLQAKHPVNLQ